MQEKSVAAKSPARGRGRPKSSSPKQKRTPARGRHSRTSAKEEEEQTGKEDEGGKEAEEEKDEEEEQEQEDKCEAAAAADKDEGEQLDDGGEPEGKSQAADNVKPADDEMFTDKPDTALADDLQAQPTAAAPTSHKDDSVLLVEEDLPHIDRKRKLEDDESDSDIEDVSVESQSKVLKVCEESDVKTVSIEATSAVDGEMTTGSVQATKEANVTTESKMSLPLSSEIDIEDDYVVITPDDVPPVDSDEVLNTVKMMPSLSYASCSNNTSDTMDVLLHREYIPNPAVSTADASRCFTLGSYNILADYHAQKDYGRGRAPWLTAEELSLSSRHKRLMEELVYLDEDIICLQEVGGDYMQDMLQPFLER